ncbi:MAG: bi-domain-containing oxidoreductase [Acidobacteria bacterium]|nr:bi-domain-containing oxidoreductase [Acidobacteriota bacterium]
MRQVILSYKTGTLTVADVPPPLVRPGAILVKNVKSAVSSGTEKLVMDLARKSLIGKVLARPDQVRRVIDKVRTDGILEAYQQVANRLDSPVPLGYSCAGEIIAVGDVVSGFRVGDRVACAGQGYASHGEIVCIPKNLCVPIPATVDYESAAFVMLGAIALHGVRMAKPQLGERVVVLGLGLLGQITAQILKAAGCHVLGVDIEADKVSLARRLGAEAGSVMVKDDVIAAVAEFTGGVGADAVLILAGTTSNQPIEVAGEISRERGRIVAVGAVRLDIPRNLFFEKELGVIVSRASGPGTFDSQYEERGLDYPVSYVRWSQQRNMEEFLELISRGQVDLGPLITHRFPIEHASEAYDLLLGRKKEPYIGVLLSYDPKEEQRLPATGLLSINQAPVPKKASRPSARKARQPTKVGLIGAGLFAKTTLLPALKGISNIKLSAVASATGSSARHVGDKFGFEYCTADYRELLRCSDIDCVFICTRHHLHAPMAVEALRAGKHVFVEKPLALTLAQVYDVIDAVKDQGSRRLLMVGFNRRFSPFSVQAKQWLTPRTEPLIINCRVNAGFVPKDSWVHDPVEGGGRIIGEVCHFVDLIQYLTDSVPTRVYAEAISGASVFSAQDNVVITLKLADGSVATITYTAAGDRAFPRERIEIFGGGAACAIDNFRSISFRKKGSRKNKRNLLRLDRGHGAECEAFFAAIRGENPLPVDFNEYVYTTLATFATEESLRCGVSIPVNPGALRGVEKETGPLVQENAERAMDA